MATVGSEKAFRQTRLNGCRNYATLQYHPHVSIETLARRLVDATRTLE